MRSSRTAPSTTASAVERVTRATREAVRVDAHPSANYTKLIGNVLFLVSRCPTRCSTMSRGVVLGAVDEARLAAAQEVQPDPVEPRRIARRPRRRGGSRPCGRAPGRPATSSRRGTRWPRARCRSRSATRSTSSRGASGTRVGSGRALGPSPRPSAAARASIVSSSRVELEVGEVADVAQRAGERARVPSRTAARRPTSVAPRAVSALRSRSARSGVPTSCGDGTWRARTRSSTSS